ncbi:hypothetical protein [Microbulbifer epialgicus]|uniref:hypothetical protein n=1 Tax=Microbulbifer epialgicus TaxID=393907 RepID=UPI0035311BA8
MGARRPLNLDRYSADFCALDSDGYHVAEVVIDTDSIQAGDIVPLEKSVTCMGGAG